MSGEHILVAEDSREIRQFLEETVLAGAGYHVRSVGDGLSALTLALELRPDLVITDHQMPSLLGLDLVRRLRSELPGVPAILITGEGSEALAAEALRAGAADYLTKPFEAESMLAAVRRALDARRPSRPPRCPGRPASSGACASWKSSRASAARSRPCSIWTPCSPRWSNPPCA